MNTKFCGYLVDGKVLFYRFRGLRLFLHLVTALIGENINESLSLSTGVQQAKDILEGDLHQLFAGFLLGSSQALPLFNQVPYLRLTDTDNRRCLRDREFWFGYF